MAPKNSRAVRRPVPDVNVFRPQHDEVLRLLRTHQLGAPLDDLAAAIVLRTMIITWQQIKTAHPEITDPALPGRGQAGPPEPDPDYARTAWP